MDSKNTYPASEHKLDIHSIDPDALFVMAKLRDAGHTAYLVGGSVRDLLLQQTPKDYDISTSARPEEIKKLFRNSLLIGRRFRLAHIRFGKKILEVSTFRSGNTESDALIVRDNEWGTPEEDALRRDFTINGLFYNSDDETIIDYVGGYPDIQKKTLRTIGQPFLRFKQDPVRMIRMLKFQARFNLIVEPEVRIALLECRGEIIKSSQARILEELLRMLESGASEPFFRLMADHGILELLMPKLSSFLETRLGDDIYGYLREIDLATHDSAVPLLDRAILLCCLIFPMLQEYIEQNFVQRKKTPHLGEILQAASLTIDSVFRPFFLLSRRLKATMNSILISQFRLTPLEQRRGKMRIPSDPDFALALKFLHVRSCLEPGLKKIWEEWLKLFHSTEPSPTKNRRRRRKRKKISGGDGS